MSENLWSIICVAAVVTGVAKLAWPESSTAENIGVAGAAVAGVAMSAWVVSKLLAILAWGASKIPQNNNDYCTLHYSGSDINQLPHRGAGCIIRNKRGELVIAVAYNLDKYGKLDPLQMNVAVAEAIAWRYGLKLAKVKKIKLDRVMGDNEEVIKRVRFQMKAPKDGFFKDNEFVTEIQKALREQSIDQHRQVHIIRSDDNKIANKLAYSGTTLGYGEEKSYEREEELPSEVAQLIQKDKMNWRGTNFLMLCNVMLFIFVLSVYGVRL